MIEIAPLSLGLFCIAAICAVLAVFQFWLFFKRPDYHWTAWGAGVSLAAGIYGIACFLQYNTPAGGWNRTAELLQFSAYPLLVQCLYGFTFAFLGASGRRYHIAAAAGHTVMLGLIWCTEAVVGRQFVQREFLWQSHPYTEPALNGLGPAFMLYGLASCALLLPYWFRAWKRRIPSAGQFLAIFLLWLLFGIHDAAGIFLPDFVPVQFLLGYGTLGFSLAIISITLQQYMAMFDLAAEQTRALKKSETKYRLLAENASDLIWIMDLAEGRISYTSPSVERILGYRQEEIAGMKIDRLIADDSREAADRLLAEELRIDSLPQVDPSRTRTLELKQVRKDGGRIWTEITLRFVRDEKGAPVSVLGLTRDVTARKTAEQELRRHRRELEAMVAERTVELETANCNLKQQIAERKEAEHENRRLEMQLRQAQKMEAVGTLAGGIAHDFNNILAAILGYAELAQYDLRRDCRARKRIDQVVKAGNRARELVRQILTFSRQSDLEKRPLDLGAAVDEALKLLRATLPAAVEIRKRFAPEPGTVTANPTQIHQLMMNLCTNAVHAMEGRSGVIEIAIGRRRLSRSDLKAASGLASGSRDCLCMTVADDGCGMTAEVMERIFDPYFTTKQIGKGTGMGLSVVHGIVQDLGGCITAESTPGRGTSFTVLLPRTDADRGHPKIDAVSLPTGSERILFVEDERPLARLGKTTLTRLGYRTAVRTDPVEALEAFSARPEAYDLVITDMNMPKMSGDRLAQAVMKIRPDIPVILCTGFSESIDEEGARLLGIDKLLMKPLAMADLARAVRDSLDRDPLRSSGSSSEQKQATG